MTIDQKAGNDVAKRNKPNKRRTNNKGNKGKRGKQRNGKSKSTQRDDGTFKLKLKAMANGGYALGTHQRRTTFVPYTIPGETVRVRLVDQQKSVDFAAGVELIAASGDRVYPQCPHFGPGRCWGCQWQHIDYPAQLLLKQDVLADQLSRLGKIDDSTLQRAVKAVIPAPEQWHYNHHITFERREDGTFGLPRIDGRTVEPITLCHVLHPELQDLYEQLDIDFGEMERLTLYRGSDGKTMILIAMSSENAPELMADMPTSVNIVLPDNEPANLVGEASVTFAVGGRNFRMTAGGTFRPNIVQIDTLIANVLRMMDLDASDSVLDLYAGVGIFSAFFAPRVEVVTMVESYPPAATDAEVNLEEFENVDIVEGSVENVLASILETEAEYNIALVDPPGSGMSKTALQSLSDLKIPKLVYVSSDPASLARDARALEQAGYTLQEVQAIDFAPQTYYIDTVALFTL